MAAFLLLTGAADSSLRDVISAEHKLELSMLPPYGVRELRLERVWLLTNVTGRQLSAEVPLIALTCRMHARAHVHLSTCTHRSKI